MTEQEARRIVLEELRRVAPELEADLIDPDASLRDEADIDSLDFLSFAEGLGERIGVDISEDDYPELRTLTSTVLFVSKVA